MSSRTERAPSRWTAIGAARLTTSVIVALAIAAPSARALELEVELGTGATGSVELGDVWFFSPLLALGAPISENVDIQVTWGFTIATASGAPEGTDATRFQPGAPLLAFPWRLSEGLVFAPGLTLPSGHLPGKDEPAYAIASAAINGGRGIRGRFDEWLWLTDELSFVLPLHYATWTNPFIFELDTALAVVVATRSVDAGASRDDDFLLQIAGRMAWRVVPNLWLGVRLQATYIPTNTNDNAQVSIAPELRWCFPDADGGGNVSARLLINLDTPYGPSFGAGRLWGLHLGTGWSF